MKYFQKNLMLSMVFCITYTVAFAQENNTEKGELYLVNETYIAPDSYDAFMEYNKAYKKLADELEGPEYYVIFANGSYRFSGGFGKEISGLGELYKKWEEWNSKPEVMELNIKYSYVGEYYNLAIWRYDTDLSYFTMKLKEGEELKYRRYTEFYVKSDKIDEFKEFIKDYIVEYKALGLEGRISAYWNKMGREAPCLMVLSLYKDEEDWAKLNKLNSEKTEDNEKIKELNKKFRTTLRKSERYEGYPVKDISHSNVAKDK